MQSQEARKTFRWYHAVITALLLLSGLGSIGFGVYLIFKDPIRAFQLSYVHESNLSTFLSVAYITIVAGTVLCIVAIFGALSDRNNRIVTILYISLLICVLIALIFVCFVSFSLLNPTTGSEDNDGGVLNVKGILKKAWENTVANDKDRACDVQRQYNCYGFDDDVCVGCWSLNADGNAACDIKKQSTCPYCPDVSTNITQGCFTKFIEAASPVYKALGIVSIIVSVLLVVDIPIVFCF